MGVPETISEFQKSLENSGPPGHWPEPLKALWYDARGNWEASHDIAQEMYSGMGSWIHGYLHWKEGDRWNAGYWYRKAGRPFPGHSLEDEFKILLQAALKGAKDGSRG